MLRFYKTLWRALSMEEARGPIIGAVLLILSGTIFYMLIEDWTLVDSLYFSVTTLTTVGFGNPAPTTDLGKLFTVVFVIGGVGIFLGVLNAIGLAAAKEPVDLPLAQRLRVRRHGDGDDTPEPDDQAPEG